MSTATPQEYAAYFLGSKASVVAIETLEIYHPAFSKTYWIQRNVATGGVTATLEDGRVVTFDYYPLRISSLGTRDNLDYGLRVDLGDLGEVIPMELDNVMIAAAAAGA